MSQPSGAHFDSREGRQYPRWVQMLINTIKENNSKTLIDRFNPLCGMVREALLWGNDSCGPKWWKGASGGDRICQVEEKVSGGPEVWEPHKASWDWLWPWWEVTDLGHAPSCPCPGLVLSLQPSPFLALLWIQYLRLSSHHVVSTEGLPCAIGSGLCSVWSPNPS